MTASLLLAGCPSEESAVTPPTETTASAAPASDAAPEAAAAPAAGTAQDPTAAQVADATPAEPVAASTGASTVAAPASALPAFGQTAYAALPLEKPAAKDATGMLKLTGVVAAGAKALKDPIQWTVVRPASGDKPMVAIARETSAQPTIKLAPGRYIVEAIWKGTSIQHDVIVPPGKPHTEVVNFNAGTIRLKMIPNSGAPAISSPVQWELFLMRKGAGGKPTDADRLFIVTAPTHEFTLPATNYIVRASYAGTSADLVVPVEAGHTYKYTINLYAGRVGFSAPGGGDDILWQIYKAKPDATGKRELVTTQTGASPNFLLREGKYVVVATAGNLVGEQLFEVRAGNSSKVRVTLKAKVANAG
jgi:hypothetical protein